MARESLRRLLVERLRFLREIGIEDLRLPVVSSPRGAFVPAALPLTSGSPASLGAIREDMGECTRCRLSRSRTRIVFGVGRPDADLLFVGEAPGREEDLKGEPFVGKAGQLLDRMVSSIGLRREDVYIANIVKCRPPENRNPQPDEIEACSGFLWRQIEAVRPKVIVALGKFAASTLLGEEIAITRARGRFRLARGFPVMPTYHPAFLLRQYTAENRRAVYDDLLRVKAVLEGEQPAP